MNTIESIENRRSIRLFKSDNISKEIVEDILNCGRLAPSAKNRQPWYFVITKGKTKDKIADMMIEYTIKNDNWIIGDNLSIGACVENMCLRATELEIGTLWIRDTVYVAEDVAKMLNHENMELNCALAIGYANQSPKQRPRKELKDIVEWYDE